METLIEVQRRHKEIIKTFDQCEFILSPHKIPAGKRFDLYFDDGALEKLAKMSDFISNDFCKVTVTNQNFIPQREEHGKEHEAQVINIEGLNFGYSFAPDKISDLKKVLETRFKEAESMTKKASKAIHSAPAQKPAELTETSELTAELKNKEEAARYLYGKKKGSAWGIRTQADEKRADEINNLKARILSITNPNLLKKDSTTLPNDSKKVYICALQPQKIEEKNQIIDELKTVNFQIEGKYIDQIKAGTKIEDYRSIGPVNAKKLCDHIDKKELGPDDNYVKHFKEIWRVKKDLTHVRFFNGYKSDRKELVVELKDLKVYTYRKIIPEGMKPGTSCFTLFLGQIVVSKNFTDDLQ